MKSILKKVAGIAMVVALVFGIVGCSNNADTHEHTFATEWTNDTAYHWHAATCEHTDLVKDKTEHSFGEWTVTAQPTEDAEGIKYKECSECHYRVVEGIAKLDHIHTFATAYTSDATYHWHAATCGHTTEVKDKAEHTFGEWTSNDDASVFADGTKSRICSTCQYKETVADEGTKITPTVTRLDDNFVKITGVPIKGTETWTPSSVVFESGKQFTIPTLIACDHEVTRDEFKTVMGIDPSMSDAYDKNGNKLSGDSVLNNPVDSVNWYDAITYCNKLSIAENLTPCYTVEGITDWKNLAYDSIPKLRSNDIDIWNAATCNFDANGYRLPTEAEWEWLARGGENYIYAGSDTLEDVAWCTSNTINAGTRGTREVKTRAANGYGLYDMSGNLSEWCWDKNTYERIYRGGSYSRTNTDISGIEIYTVYLRRGNWPQSPSKDYGFRVVRTAK